MTEQEIVDAFRSCHVIYMQITDRRNHELTRAEMATLGKFKVIWNKDLSCYQGLMDKAGLTQNELAYLATYLYYNH